jgi:CheY-like chemotaxis protein
MRVLLVEDIRDNQISACELLFRWGIIPVIAINGLMAVKIFQKQMFDIILMDISMPVMNGLEATLEIRREELSHPDHPRCPIVAYTTGGTANHRELWRKIGIDAGLKKPSQPEQMEACLHQWCGQTFDAFTRFGVGLKQK